MEGDQVQEYVSGCVRGLLEGKDESMKSGIPKVAGTTKKETFQLSTALIVFYNRK